MPFEVWLILFQDHFFCVWKKKLHETIFIYLNSKARDPAGFLTHKNASKVWMRRIWGDWVSTPIWNSTQSWKTPISKKSNNSFQVRQTSWNTFICAFARKMDLTVRNQIISVTNPNFTFQNRTKLSWTGCNRYEPCHCQELDIFRHVWKH